MYRRQWRAGKQQKIGATKHLIGRIGPLRQGKPTHRTQQDVVPTPRVGVMVGARCVSESRSSVRIRCGIALHPQKTNDSGMNRRLVYRSIY